MVPSTNLPRPLLSKLPCGRLLQQPSHSLITIIWICKYTTEICQKNWYQSSTKLPSLTVSGKWIRMRFSHGRQSPSLQLRIHGLQKSLSSPSRNHVASASPNGVRYGFESWNLRSVLATTLPLSVSDDLDLLTVEVGLVCLNCLAVPFLIASASILDPALTMRNMNSQTACGGPTQAACSGQLVHSCLCRDLRWIG